MFWGHCNLHTLSGLCLFCNSNCMKLLFPDTFDELLSLYALLFSPKICLVILSSTKYSPCWSFKLTESNKFKVDIKSSTGLVSNADMWLTNLVKRTHTILSLDKYCINTNTQIFKLSFPIFFKVLILCLFQKPISTLFLWISKVFTLINPF